MPMRIVIFSLFLGLTACTFNHLPQPKALPTLAIHDAVWFQLEQADITGQSMQSSLLAIEQTANEIRFVQTNALGAPITRQVFNQQGWHNDGFVMPNAESRRLFSALLFVLATNRAAAYPYMTQQMVAGEECYLQQGKNSWCIKNMDKGWSIRFPNQTQWQIQVITDVE